MALPAKSGPLGNCDVVLSYHASETLNSGVPREIGFNLVRDEKGQAVYQAVDTGRAEVIRRVQEAGFTIDPETMEAVFYKDDWSGPFGAYEERPGQNRPALSENADLKGQKPICGPKRYELRGKSRTASTISMDGPSSEIRDSGGGLGFLVVGDYISTSGFTNSVNNKTGWRVVTVAAGAVQIIDDMSSFPGLPQIPVTEAAGNSITVRLEIGIVNVSGNITTSERVKDIVNFNSKLYVGAGCFVYESESWGTPGAGVLIRVYKHITATAVFTKFHVHNGYLYASFGTSGVYAYTADGTTWTESNRGGTDAQSTEMVTLRGVLHKRLGQNHYQLVAATDNGINGGTTWGSADQIGDTAYTITRMLVAGDALVFGTTNGMVSLDGEGNITDLFAESHELGIVGNEAIQSWYGAVFFPTDSGTVYLYSNGIITDITPAQQIERLLPVTMSPNLGLTAPVKKVGIAGDYLYVLQEATAGARALELHRDGDRFVWRILWDTANYYSNMFFKGVATPSNILTLFYAEADQYGCYYYVLPHGNDATQYSTSRYTSASEIYDPWITFGVPEIQKRWSYVQACVTQSTPANYAKTTYNLDAFNEAGTQIMDDDMTMAQGITVESMPFTHATLSNIVSRRVRLVHNLGNTGANQELETPILLWIKVVAKILAPSRYRFRMLLDVPSASVAHGLASQEEARAFFDQMRDAQLPMTLEDIYGNSYTVNPVAGQPTESAVNKSHVRWNENYELVLQEQVAGT